MEPSERPELEAAVRRLSERGENERAVEVALEGYGPEMGRFMVSVLHDAELAADAFGLFCECLLKGLPGFRWESSLRTWAYRLARNACYQLLRSPSRREELASEPLSIAAVQRERSRTQPWMQTQVKERFRALREKLDVEDRMLLMLRVDRRLSWTEIAEVLAEQEGAGGRERERRAAALRQQFQRLKARLRTLAVEEGLVEEEEEPPPSPAAR